MNVRLLAPALLLAMMSFGARVSADVSPADKSLAEALFRDGKKLLAEGRVAEACAKLAESHKIAPAIGTLLNLAVCHEKEGRLATAWAEYSTVATQASKSGDSEREAFARDQMKALEPRVPRLIVIAEEVPPGLVVRLDGLTMSAAALGSALPLDPGEHAVTATAPNRKEWSSKVTIPSAGETTTLRIPPLAIDAPPPPPAPPPPAPVTRDLRPTIGWVTVGVGAAGLAVGTFFGVRTFSLKSDADCSADKVCRTSGDLEKIDDAKTAATISTIGFGVGLAAIGVGTYLLVTGSRAPTQTGLLVTPVAGPSGGGLSLSAAF